MANVPVAVVHMNRADTELVDGLRLEDLKKVRHALLEGANVNEPDEFGLTPLHSALCRWNTDLLRAVLLAGPKLDTLVPRTIGNLNNNAGTLKGDNYIGYLLHNEVQNWDDNVDRKLGSVILKRSPSEIVGRIRLLLLAGEKLTPKNMDKIQQLAKLFKEFRSLVPILSGSSGDL